MKTQHSQKQLNKMINACVLTHFHLVQFFVTLWTVAHLSMGQLLCPQDSLGKILEWMLCPPPVNLPASGIELVSPVSPSLQADSLPLSHWGNLKGSIPIFKNDPAIQRQIL